MERTSTYIVFLLICVFTSCKPYKNIEIYNYQISGYTCFIRTPVENLHVRYKNQFVYTDKNGFYLFEVSDTTSTVAIKDKDFKLRYKSNAVEDSVMLGLDKSRVRNVEVLQNNKEIFIKMTLKTGRNIIITQEELKEWMQDENIEMIKNTRQ